VHVLKKSAINDFLLQLPDSNQSLLGWRELVELNQPHIGFVGADEIVQLIVEGGRFGRHGRLSYILRADLSFS
jgi:hypothetical protein